MALSEKFDEVETGVYPPEYTVTVAELPDGNEEVKFEPF